MTTQPPAELPPHPSIKQTANFHGVDEKTVRRYIAKGYLTAHRIGPRLIRLERESVLNLGRQIGGVR